MNSRGKLVLADLIKNYAKGKNGKSDSDYDKIQLEIDSLFFYIISVFSKCIACSSEHKKTYTVDLILRNYSSNTVYLSNQNMNFPDYCSLYVNAKDFYIVLQKTADFFNSSEMQDYRAFYKANNSNAYLCIFLSAE